jgi:hypothetical protein
MCVVLNQLFRSGGSVLTVSLSVMFTIACVLRDPVDPARNRKCWDDPKLQRISAKSVRRDVSVYSYPHLVSRAKEILGLGVEADARLRTFFQLDSRSAYRIYLAADHDQFEMLASMSTDWRRDWWLVGTALTPHDHVLMDPERWDPRSRSSVDLKKLVVHEMSHSYSLSMIRDVRQKECLIVPKSAQSPAPWSYWFEEGLATFISGQVSDWRSEISNDLAAFPDLNYATSGSVVGFLLHKFGRERIFSAIRSMPPNYAERSCASRCDKTLFDTLGISGLRPLESEWKEYKDKGLGIDTTDRLSLFSRTRPKRPLFALGNRNLGAQLRWLP